MFDYKIIINEKEIKEYKELNATFSRLTPIPSSFTFNEDSLKIIEQKKFNTFFSIENSKLFDNNTNIIFDEIYNILQQNEDKKLQIQFKLNNSDLVYNTILSCDNFGLTNRVYKIDHNTKQIFNQVQLMCKI